MNQGATVDGKVRSPMFRSASYLNHGIMRQVIVVNHSIY